MGVREWGDEWREVGTGESNENECSEVSACRLKSV